MKMLIEKLINVLWYLYTRNIEIDFDRTKDKNWYLQGPFKQDSAKTNAARTSTCLSVNRLSVIDVIRFLKSLQNE